MSDIASFSFLRVIWASAKKDIKSSLTERSTILQCITLPINYLILLSLFALGGSNAPTAVVMLDQGPYAQKFLQAMSSSHSYRLIPTSSTDAEAQIHAGQIVAVVTIPANFDERVQHKQPVQIDMQVNNLNTDMTDDVRRAIRLSITSFYATTFPNQVNLVMAEHDSYSQDTDYIPFLAMSILVIGLMVAGLLQAGQASAREWEKATVKELLLAPTSRWAILVGKMLGALIMGIGPIIAVLAVLIFVVGDKPVHLLLVIGVSLLTLLVFVALGVALGMLLKQRIVLTTITRGISVPLFFLSGVFAPISFSTPAVAFIARIFPVHYAVVLEQYGFKNFTTNTIGLLPNGLILAAFAVVFIIIATTSLSSSRITH